MIVVYYMSYCIQQMDASEDVCYCFASFMSLPRYIDFRYAAKVHRRLCDCQLSWVKRVTSSVRPVLRYLVKRSQGPWTVVWSENYDFLWLKFIFSMWQTILSWFQVHIFKSLHYRLGPLDFLRGPGVWLRLLMLRTYSLGLPQTFGTNF